MSDLSILAQHTPEIVNTWGATLSAPLSELCYLLWQAMEDAHRFTLRTIMFAPAVSLREEPDAAWIVMYKARASGRHQLLNVTHFSTVDQHVSNVFVHEMNAPLYPQQTGQIAQVVRDLVTSLYDDAAFVLLEDWPGKENEHRAILRRLADG